jgi:hypothetical protein
VEAICLSALTRIIHFKVSAAIEAAAGTGPSAWFLGGRGFLAEFADDRNQAFHLGFVQSAAERRHVSLALIDLREDFGVGQLLGFRGAQILGPDRFSDYRAPAAIRGVTLSAVRVIQFLAVGLRCRNPRKREKQQREDCDNANSPFSCDSLKHFSLAKY